jgi:hypothetical protein
MRGGYAAAAGAQHAAGGCEMNRSLRLFAAPAMLFIAGVPVAQACTQSGANSYGEFITVEHAKRLAVRGTFRTVKVEDRSDAGVGNWQVIFGEITLKSGKILETIHTHDNEIILCGRPEGPAGNALGTFYLNRKKKDGRFEIFDWRGNYLPQPDQSKD